MPTGPAARSPPHYARIAYCFSFAVLAPLRVAASCGQHERSSQFHGVSFSCFLLHSLVCRIPDCRLLVESSVVDFDQVGATLLDFLNAFAEAFDVAVQSDAAPVSR